MTAHCYFLVAMMVAAGPVLHAQMAIKDKVDDGRAFDVTAIVDQSDASYDQMKSVAMSAVKPNSRDLFRVTLADSAATLSRYRGHAALTMVEMANSARHSGRIGVLTGLRGNVVFSYRDGAEEYEGVVVGSDPRRIRRAGSDFRVIHFVLVKLGPGAIAQPAYALRVFLKAVSGAISVRSVADLTREFKALTNAATIAVSVRTDTWFLHDRFFPDLLPFLSDKHYPTDEEQRLAPAVTCGTDGKTLTCSGQVFRP